MGKTVKLQLRQLDSLRLTNHEIINQVTKKLDGIKRDLYLQILEAITSAFTEQETLKLKMVIEHG